MRRKEVREYLSIIYNKCEGRKTLLRKHSEVITCEVRMSLRNL